MASKDQASVQVLGCVLNCSEDGEHAEASWHQCMLDVMQITMQITEVGAA
jgi:hypothetical protein